MMKQYTSAAAFFRAANGQTVTRRLHGVATLDAWPQIVEDAKAQLIAQGCAADLIVEDESALRWPGGFMMRPKRYAIESGVMTVRSSDFIVKYPARDNLPERRVFDNKKGAIINDAGQLQVAIHGGFATYEIGN